MKTIILTMLFANIAYANKIPCRVKIFKSEYIKQNYQILVESTLKKRNFIEDPTNPEFDISFGVTCWGGCGRPILQPDTLGIRVTRISDGKMIQTEETSHLYPGSKIALSITLSNL